MELTANTAKEAAAVSNAIERQPPDGVPTELPDTLQAKDIARRSTLNNDLALVPPEYQYKMDRFGFPRPMQELAKSLKQAINRIPTTDDKNRKLRDLFMALIATNNSSSDQVFLKQVLDTIGEYQATVDLLDKRINEMTSADLIVGKEYQTPDQQSVESLRADLLKGDRERFARVDATPGGSKLEWDVMEPDDSDSPSPGF